MRFNFKYILPAFSILLFLFLTIISTFSGSSKSDVAEANKTANPNFNTSLSQPDISRNIYQAPKVLGENSVSPQNPQPTPTPLNQVLGLPADADMKIVRELNGYYRAEGVINNKKYIGITAPFNGSDYKVYFGDADPKCSKVKSYKVPEEIYIKCIEDNVGEY